MAEMKDIKKRLDNIEVGVAQKDFDLEAVLERYKEEYKNGNRANDKEMDAYFLYLKDEKSHGDLSTKINDKDKSSVEDLSKDDKVIDISSYEDN